MSTRKLCIVLAVVTYRQLPRCYVCNSLNHLAKDCKSQKTESEGKSSTPKKNGVIRLGCDPSKLDATASSLEETQFQKVVGMLFLINDIPGQNDSHGKESSPKGVTVEIEGLPAAGIIDTGSDIIIVSGNLFTTIITTAGLKEENFKPAIKQAFYNV